MVTIAIQNFDGIRLATMQKLGLITDHKQSYSTLPKRNFRHSKASHLQKGAIIYLRVIKTHGSELQSQEEAEYVYLQAYATTAVSYLL